MRLISWYRNVDKKWNRAFGFSLQPLWYSVCFAGLFAAKDRSLSLFVYAMLTVIVMLCIFSMIKRSVYSDGMRRLLFPEGITTRHKAALLYGIVGGGLVGGFAAAGYSERQHMWQIVLGATAGATVGSYALLMLANESRRTNSTIKQQKLKNK